VGPLPADTLFCRARAGEFDGVVAMYHDQGHIALKLMDFHRAVNITLGLPIIRTSPTYGTAFDIAWQGVAEIQGMLEAARVASVLAAARADTGGCLGSSGASPQPGEVMGSLRSTTATPPTPLAVQGQRR
ncbi:MAG: 4-hydroxythreonine-4-phosphate dehydrogenase PdxA, partial [Planctomycetes bacterium]|nr:4-hydroxythreonine-4-phosphate dehydrogenase PdxA [Planctomycetota bacterium]